MVSVLDCPQIERKSGEFIDFGYRRGITVQIDDDEVPFACVAREQTHVRKLRRGEASDRGFRRGIAARATRPRK